jgi:hypothetical protein
VYTYRPTQNVMLDQSVKFVAGCFQPITGFIGGHEDFGDRGEYHVATVISPQLYEVYRLLSHFHQSKWDFNPHITSVQNRLRSVGSMITFDRIGIWDDNIGEERNYRFGSKVRAAPVRSMWSPNGARARPF